MQRDGVALPGDSPSDFTGTDVMARYEQGALVPYIIESNDYHSGGMWALHDRLLEKAITGHPVPVKRLGQASRDWIDTMVWRGQSYLAQQLEVLPQHRTRAHLTSRWAHCDSL
jgi:hypothetical protein